MTKQEFLETAPLYTRVEITNFSPPESITKMCYTPDCKKETTWLRIVEDGRQKVSQSPFLSFSYTAYMCGLCKKSTVLVFYETVGWSEDPASRSTPKSHLYTAVRKVGQLPAQEIAIPPELNEQLGATAGHYKKALITRGQNYGIAAMAYMRRVIDEKTDELIDIMADLARTFAVTEEEVSALVGAKTETRYETKLQAAAELIPQALRPGGVNPLGQLYMQTSIGLHGKTDDECVAIFDDLRADFEYIFRNLHLQAQERREFAKRMQERAGKKQ